MEEALPKKPRLLIVEDNFDTQEIYKGVFEREGFQVLVATDGEMGLRYAQSTLPDAILLDLMLPKLKGFDLLKRLRAQEETRRIPVVIFSALADSSDKRQAAELGVTEYAIKSLNPPKQVVNRVRALLAGAAAADPGHVTGSYRLALKDSLWDAAGLQTLAGLPKGFCCPQCGAEVVLFMIPDLTRAPAHWFATHLVCSGCQRDY